MMNLISAIALALLVQAQAKSQPPSGLSFETFDGKLAITAAGKPLATYVWADPAITRPYFHSLHAPGGPQVTRNHPPIAGKDATDHDTFHPGLWMSFGDLSGADFWRNRARVEHVEFVDKPRTTPDGGTFTVKNRYLDGSRVICEEICRIDLIVRDHSLAIDWRSEFRGEDDFAFGDQEEMGLGVRLATPLIVTNGGRISNSDGLKNERDVWGKSALWCEFSGTIDGAPAGVAIFPSPRNFRPSWFHVRDYGLMVANPFGQHAMTGGEPSSVVVKPGEAIVLQFRVLIHAGAIDLKREYQEWQTQNDVSGR